MTVQTDYPSQYYVSYDTDGKPTGWYDTWNMSSVALVPAASEMLALTVDEWNSRIVDGFMHPKLIKGGKLIDGTLPVPTLAQQASAALTTAKKNVYNNYGILNEPTPDAWVTYLKALMALANGTDTTSTALPSAPSA